MNVLITLTSAGTDLGPFDLYSDTDGYTTPFETGVLRTQLLAGYTSTVVPDGTVTIRVTSTGACTNSIDIPVEVTTTTTTTTAAPLTGFNMSAVGFPINTVCQQGSAVPHYHNGVNALPEAGDTIYTDSGGTSPVNGGLQYWKIQGGYVQIDASGVVSLVSDCGQAFGMTNTGEALEATACANNTATTHWHDGGLINPGLGDTIYTNEELTNAKVGGNLWYHVIPGALVKIDNSGEVTEVDTCP